MRANTQRTARGGMRQEGRDRGKDKPVGNRDIRRSVEGRGMGRGTRGTQDGHYRDFQELYSFRNFQVLEHYRRSRLENQTMAAIFANMRRCSVRKQLAYCSPRFKYCIVLKPLSYLDILASVCRRMKNLANTLAHVEYVMGMFCIRQEHAGIHRSTPSSSTNFLHAQNFSTCSAYDSDVPHTLAISCRHVM